MRLDRPVALSFTQTPVRLAMENIKDKAGLPMSYDEAAIEAEGISLERADHPGPEGVRPQRPPLLLDTVGLSYVVENDVVKVTTMKKSKGRLYTKVFSVTDLVTPVPNFALPDYANLSKILSKNALDNPNVLMAGLNTRRPAAAWATGRGQPAGRA